MELLMTLNAISILISTLSHLFAIYLFPLSISFIVVSIQFHQSHHLGETSETPLHHVCLFFPLTKSRARARRAALASCPYLHVAMLSLPLSGIVPMCV